MYKNSTVIVKYSTEAKQNNIFRLPAHVKIDTSCEKHHPPKPFIYGKINDQKKREVPEKVNTIK
ncbi:MAG: hypothetical protein ACOVMN_13275 [Flexibacteraceae bacterium]